MIRSLSSSVLSTDRGPRPDDGLCAAAWVEAQLWEEALERRRRMVGWAVLSLGLGVVAGVVALVSVTVAVGVGLVAAGLVISGSLLFGARKIEPDEQVTAVSTVYWPALALPVDEDDCILYDLSGVNRKRRVRLQVLSDESTVDDLADRLHGIGDELSAFEPPDRRATIRDRALYGVDAGLGEILQRVIQALDDTEMHQVEVPAVGSGEPVISALQDIGEFLEPVDVRPVVREPTDDPLSHVHRMLLGIRSMSREGEHERSDDLLSALQNSVEELQEQLEMTHRESLALLDEIHTLSTHTTAWPSQRVFCPMCNSRDQDGGFDDLARSTSLHLTLDPNSDLLRCPVCENDIGEEEAVSLSRLKREVLNPVFDQVYLSLREEVLQIDREIENKLMDLQKEQSVAREEALRQTEQARRGRLSQLREMRSQAASLEARVHSIAEKLAEYQRLEDARQREFRKECREIRRQVERRIDEVEKKIEEEFAISDRRANLESERRAEINRVERERRHQERLEANIRIQEELRRSREELKRQLEVQLMSPDEKEAIRHEGFFDALNPAKQSRRKKARRRAREHRRHLD